MNPIKIYNKTSRFVVDWTLNTLCTYKCSYCPDELHNGINYLKSKTEDPEIIYNFLVKLRDELLGRSVHIFVNGGEPTISPSLETIIDFCNDTGWCLYVNTNASRSIDWWQEYAPKIYKVTISYHPESADEEIFDKIKLIGSVTNIGVFTLMYPVSPYWEKSVTAFERIKAMNDIRLEPTRVFQRANRANSAISYDYSEEQLQWLKENSNLNIGQHIATKAPPIRNSFGRTWSENDNGLVTRFDEVEIVNNRKNSFTGWDCNIGMDYIHITDSGHIYPAVCTVKPGRIYMTDIFNFTGLKTKPTKCIEEWCMCTNDVLISKERPNE